MARRASIHILYMLRHDDNNASKMGMGSSPGPGTEAMGGRAPTLTGDGGELRDSGAVGREEGARGDGDLVEEARSGGRVREARG